MSYEEITEEDLKNLTLPAWLLAEIPEIETPSIIDFTDVAAEFLKLETEFSNDEFNIKNFFETSIAEEEAEVKEKPKLSQDEKALARHKQIAVSEAAFFCIKKEDGTVSEAMSIKDAVNSVRDNGQDEKNGIFSKRVSMFYKDKLSTSSIFVPAPSGGSYMFSMRPLQHELDMLKYTFLQSLQNAKAYEEDPSSFENAYYFLDSHPAFWTKFKYAQKESEEESPKTFDWETSGHALKFWVVPDFKDGKHIWMMESGTHTPNYLSHYRDPGLDVYCKTMEECYIQTAALVFKYWENDGSKREEERPLTELEEVLTERISGWEETLVKEEKVKAKIEESEDFINFKKGIDEALNNN